MKLFSNDNDSVTQNASRFYSATRITTMMKGKEKKRKETTDEA